MSNKLFLLFLSFLLSISINSLFAQRYGNAVGVRLGNNNLSRQFGITFQQRILDRTSLEGILQTDFARNTNLSLLLEKHKPIISKRFNYYLGAGVSFGNEESFMKNEVDKEIIQTYGNSTMGIEAIGGLEFTIANTVLSVDYKPNFNLSGREEFYRGQVGFSARTILTKSKEQKKKQRQRQKAKKRNETEPFGEKVKSIFSKK
ncbi:hypothetical protein [Algoriphagus sp.]|uniref:hypothetical protein n=1 Tax=Algoriphagus sp. TaxID=1872435 RepID=UPI0025F12588|nr:hypothetical protein [Algoriphagus sp.]